MPDRAITYARVSTDAQGDEGSSLVTQRDRCLAYCHEQGYMLVEHHEDTHTGSRYRERPGLTALRAAVRAGLCDVVVCYAIDRLSRNQAHLYVLAEELEDAGVRLEFVTESFEDSAVGRFLRSAKAFAAEVEREKIAERSIRGKIARLQSGRLIIPRTPLYGYLPNADRTGYVLNPDTSPVVARIYRSVMEGQTLRGIARQLMDEGIPSPSGGRAWAISTISTMLHLPAYTGRAWSNYRRRSHGAMPWEMEHAIELPAGTIPPIVDEATWEAVRHRLLRNRERAARNSREPFASLLRGGIARCGGCGRALTVKQYPSSTSRIYFCSNYRNDAYPCDERTIMATHTLDAQVWAALVDVIRSRPHLLMSGRFDPDAHETAARDRDRLERTIRDLTRRQRNLTRELSAMDDAGAAGAIRAELVDITGQLRVATADLAGTESRIASHAAAVDDARSVREWARRIEPRLDSMGLADRRMVLEMLSLTVSVYRRGRTPRWTMVYEPPVT